MGEPQADTVYQGDCVEIMRAWPDACVDACITDPPFNMSARPPLAWAFSSHVTMREAWDSFSQDDFWKFSVEWLREVARVVRPNGNILVFGTFHSVYQTGFILQALGLKIVNSIVWYKPNAQPNITCRTLTESTEHIVWAVNNSPRRARGWTFNYEVSKEIGEGRQLRNVWPFPVTPARERNHGKHPTQKPLALVERLVRLMTREGDLVADCFAGTGTLALAARRHRRHWVLVERSPDYAEIIRRRLEEQACARALP